MSKALRKKTAMVLVERKISELMNEGHSEKSVLRSIGIERLEDLHFLTEFQLLDCHAVLREQLMQLSLFDIAQ